MSAQKRQERASGRLAIVERFGDVLRLVTAVFIIVLIAMVAYLGYQNNLAKKLSGRADCRAAINAELQDVKDARFNTVLAVVFNHKPAGTPLTLAETLTIVKANKKVDALPSLPYAVDNGATINGEHFSACPKV